MANALSPMEINPEVLNKLMIKLGFLPTLKFVDVLGFDEEYLKSFPYDACAVLLLFPLTPQHEAFRKKQEEEQKDKEVDELVFFMKQTVENSCGMVGIVHATGNNSGRISFGHDAAMMDFLDKCIEISPERRAKIFEESEDLWAIHNAVAAEGHCRPSEDGVHFHFITFVPVEGMLYELDGLTEKPIVHGTSCHKTLLQDAGKICKQFTEREQDEVRFSCVALVRAT